MNDIKIKGLIEAALKKKEVKVYRGTIKDETLEFFKSAKKARDMALEQFDAKRREFWSQVYEELALPQDKQYYVESLTGQVFEEVPVDNFKKEAESEGETRFKEAI